MRKFLTKLLLHKKWMLLALLAVIAIKAGLAMYNNNQKANAAPQQMARVERGNLSSLVAASGSIQPVNMVDISSKITAQIKEVKVKENDQVKAGDILVVLEDDQIQPQLIQAKERLQNAAANYDRNKRLNSIGAVSNQQLDTGRMDYNIAQANYDEIMSKVQETVITAPIDGTVIGKPLPAGETVAQGVANPIVILTIADMSKMQIEAQVDQTDIGKVAMGQKVTFTVDAYPEKIFSGTVSNISHKAVVQQNVTYYTVTIDIKAGENLLKPSMVARVSIITGESKDALTLPLSAIRTDKSGKYVVIAKQNSEENVRVTTGIVGEERVEILTGLNEGDSVVIPQIRSQVKQSNASFGRMPR